MRSRRSTGAKQRTVQRVRGVDSAGGTGYLGLKLATRPMRRGQVHAVLLEVRIESVAFVGAIADEMFGLDFEHVEVGIELDQRDLNDD